MRREKGNERDGKREKEKVEKRDERGTDRGEKGRTSDDTQNDPGRVASP